MRPQSFSVSPFVVRVPEIPDEGLIRTLDLGGSFLQGALAGSEADLAASTARAHMELHRTGHDVLARGKLDGELLLVCSRCAGPATVALGEAFQVMFVPRAEVEATEVEPESEDPDVLGYDADEIDLGEMLREELLLAMPIAPLCNATCRGLCPRCGADLNAGPCNCGDEPKDDRWAPLKSIKVPGKV